jgi:hypothetical protein
VPIGLALRTVAPGQRSPLGRVARGAFHQSECALIADLVRARPPSHIEQ